MKDKLKLGVIGLSEGNGHPYSWSAIFNGYDPVQMARCPFPVIPDYLAKQTFPNDFLTHLGEVTCVWTQDQQISADVAKASKIRNVVKDIGDMAEQVDAVLLARDDAKNHKVMALPFLKAGLPIFIDKPFSITMADADAMLSAQQYDGQIFTCSSLRFAEELQLTKDDQDQIGEVVYVEGSVMKKWETYGIHILEPLVSQLPHRGKLLSVTPTKSNDVQVVNVRWENCMGTLRITGNVPSPLSFTFYGRKGFVTKNFKDSYSCFRASLKAFTEVIATKKKLIETTEVLELVSILEKGTC